MTSAIKKLQAVPGIGPKLAKDFSDTGIKEVSDFRGKNPEELYMQICSKKGMRVDRCVLYVCRSSVYFAENENHDPEKLKWWNWQDKKMKGGGKIK